MNNRHQIDSHVIYTKLTPYIRNDALSHLTDPDSTLTIQQKQLFLDQLCLLAIEDDVDNRAVIYQQIKLILGTENDDDIQELRNVFENPHESIFRNYRVTEASLPQLRCLSGCALYYVLQDLLKDLGWLERYRDRLQQIEAMLKLRCDALRQQEGEVNLNWISERVNTISQLLIDIVNTGGDEEAVQYKNELQQKRDVLKERWNQLMGCQLNWFCLTIGAAYVGQLDMVRAIIGGSRLENIIGSAVLGGFGMLAFDFYYIRKVQAELERIEGNIKLLEWLEKRHNREMVNGGIRLATAGINAVLGFFCPPTSQVSLPQEPPRLRD